MSGNGTRPRRARADWYADVMRLRKLGLTYDQVGAELNITESFVRDLLYDPDGSKSRARKQRYCGVCVGCGGPTCGGDGRAKAPERCYNCRKNYESTVLRIWTRDTVIAAIQRWAAEHGRPPHATDFLHARDGYPSFGSVYRTSWDAKVAPFTSWADAIEAAGFPRPGIGTYDRRSGEAGLGEAERYALARARRRPASGVTSTLVANERGTDVGTARRTLLSLERRGLLERDTDGRPHVFRAANV